MLGAQSLLFTRKVAPLSPHQKFRMVTHFNFHLPAFAVARPISGIVANDVAPIDIGQDARVDLISLARALQKLCPCAGVLRDAN